MEKSKKFAEWIFNNAKPSCSHNIKGNLWLLNNDWREDLSWNDRFKTTDQLYNLFEASQPNTPEPQLPLGDLKTKNSKLLSELIAIKTIKEDYYKRWQNCEKQKNVLQDKYSKLKQKQDTNKQAWMGKSEESGQNIETNLIFEAESTMEPQALSKNPEPVVYCGSDLQDDEKARSVKVMLQYHADVLNLKPKLGKMLTHWDIYYTAAIKHGWDDEIGDIKSDIIYPTNLIFDKNGYVNENMDFVGKYIGEKKRKSVKALIESIISRDFL